MSTAADIVVPSFRDALRFWWLLGWIGFGGPAGQIAIMHAELVERRRWIDEARFLEGLNFCMLLPGPEAQQLATYVGWRLHGVRGALVAGTLFVLPAVALLWLLSLLYVRWGALPQAAGVLDGLQAAVLALLAHALWRLGRRVLAGPVALALAALAWIAVALAHAPFPLVLAGAALAGMLLMREAPSHGPEVVDAGTSPAAQRAARRAALACTALWLGAVALAVLLAGPDSTLARIALFFSKAALVTFGGAYAVLPYVAERAVVDYGWLDTGQMMTGLALAETTPGPLIMVLQFVGFLAGWQHPDPGLSPLAAATLGALLTTWVTFLPSIALVLAGAPYIARLARTVAWRRALAGIAAAVLGVIANLAFVFGEHALLAPGGFRWAIALLACALGLLLARGRIGVPIVVAAGVLAGLALRAFG